MITLTFFFFKGISDDIPHFISNKFELIMTLLNRNWHNNLYKEYSFSDFFLILIKRENVSDSPEVLSIIFPLKYPLKAIFVPENSSWFGNITV